MITTNHVCVLFGPAILTSLLFGPAIPTSFDFNLFLLYSKLWYRFLRVMPWDPQIKRVCLSSPIKTITVELKISLGDPAGFFFFMFNAATVWRHAHDDAH